MNYYNEWDKDAAAWLRELIKAGLIPDGEVDERSITEIKAHELTSSNQCHFFAGIGGWPIAFSIAGVGPDENADSGSCPCQPFSSTGKQMGFADPRHLWPAFRRVIGKRQPATVYGEQVASKLGREWISRVFSDLAFMGYAGSGADLCSAGVGSPNIRQRLYWVGNAVCERRNEGPRQSRNVESSGCWQLESSIASGPIGMAITDCERLTGKHSLLQRKEPRRDKQNCAKTTGSGATIGMAHATSGRFGTNGRTPGSAGYTEQCSETSIGLGYADHARREGRLIRWDGPNKLTLGAAGLGMWANCELVFCRDSKWRRIEPGSFPLADGIPSRVGPLLTELRKLGKSSIALARANRNIRLKGYGNAINPWVAARFITAARAGMLGRLSAPRTTLTLSGNMRVIPMVNGECVTEALEV